MPLALKPLHSAVDEKFVVVALYKEHGSIKFRLRPGVVFLAAISFRVLKSLNSRGRLVIAASGCLYSETQKY